MRIFVTGSLGTLGAPLAAELNQRGHDVWGCDLRHSGEPNYIRADVAERRQLERAFDQVRPEFVYHLAAEFGRLNGEAFYEPLWRTAMVGTRNVLELSKEHGARVGFASSSEVYGEAEADWLDEGLTEREHILHPNEYALSKWANERQILSFRQRYGLDVTRLRFFNAYGPGEAFHPYRSVVALFCHKALRGETLPVFEGYKRTFMHADDFIPTLANVCTAELGYDVYNIGGIDYREVRELAELVVAEAGSGEIEMIPEDKHNIRAKRPSISRAIADLGHDPKITLEEGVPQTLAWMADRVRA